MARQTISLADKPTLDITKDLAQENSGKLDKIVGGGGAAWR